ncbi:molybdopterin-dependent oxidoreductase, partial [Salmonella enterica]|uniref:molybdopterin-dependent oxidoreductase n=1 Tax=Salmonella enterica TaxID=28901 RepID=UPI00398C6B64
FIHSESRLKYPQYRALGSDKWQQISWEHALDRIAKLMKEDRDAKYQAQTAEGVTVNHWRTTGLLCATPFSTETGNITKKFSPELGMLVAGKQTHVCHGPTVAIFDSKLCRGTLTKHCDTLEYASLVQMIRGKRPGAHLVAFGR